MMIPTHAISIRQPWLELIRRVSPVTNEHPKQIEFRCWPMPDQFVGEWVALHATKRACPDWSFWATNIYFVPEHPPPPLGAICALARFDMSDRFRPDTDYGMGEYGDEPGFPTEKRDAPGALIFDVWYAWPILQVVSLTPIPCCGYQRFWQITDDVRRQIRRQFIARPDLPRLAPDIDPIIQPGLPFTSPPQPRVDAAEAAVAVPVQS